METQGQSIRRRRVTVIGAASSIGIKPYDGGKRARSLDRAPEALRAAGLIERLGADDRGTWRRRPTATMRGDRGRSATKKA